MKVNITRYVDQAYDVMLDNTMLTAAVTCPRWYKLRYGEGKTFMAGGRAMPLEAGKACHEVYAAARLWELRHNQGLGGHMEHHGAVLFGEQRFDSMYNSVDSNKEPDYQRLDFCLAALETSGFTDDERDKKRTFVNLEESCINYLQRYKWGVRPVWVRDVHDCTAEVGIEVKVDTLVVFTDVDYELRVRFIGRVDGIHTNKKGQLEVHENKTTGRLNDQWCDQWQTSHQITGYCLNGSALMGLDLCYARVIGMSIPLPRSGYDYGGVTEVQIHKTTNDYQSWLTWLYHTCVHNILPWRDEKYTDTPMYTHSCNRYFRTCQFMPLCTSEYDDVPDMIDDMVVERWNPLDDTRE